jgi:hypothetical protein
MAAAQAAAEQAIAANIRAFRRAADAHERAAIEHERAVAGGSGDKDEHERQAAIHRAAAATDMQRAEHEPHQRGPHLRQVAGMSNNSRRLEGRQRFKPAKARGRVIRANTPYL